MRQQWNQAANAHLGNIVIKQQSGSNSQWTCDQRLDGHPHVWTATVRDKTRGSNCPYCAGTAVCAHNSLATLAPETALEWDYAKNSLTPHDYTGQSNVRASWACRVCQHSWKVPIMQRAGLSGSHCPACVRKAGQGRPKPKKPTVAEPGLHYMAHWDHECNAQDGLLPGKVTLGSNKKVDWVCHGCPQGLLHR